MLKCLSIIRYEYKMQMERINFVQYVYLFIRYAGVESGIWLVNKIVLMVIGLFLWGLIYIICKN